MSYALPDSPILGWGLPAEGEALLPLNVHSQAYANKLFVKSGPGMLYGFGVYSSNAGAQFIQVHDTQAVPASGAIPCWVGTVAASSNINVIWIPGRPFNSGCWVVNSSTGPTYTAGSADTFFDAQFV